MFRLSGTLAGGSPCVRDGCSHLLLLSYLWLRCGGGERWDVGSLPGLYTRMELCRSLFYSVVDVSE